MFAGTQAVNCGRVKPGQDPDTSSDCALAAFQHRKPFYVSYDDAWRWASSGFAGNSEGDVQFVEYKVIKFPEFVRNVVELADDNHIIFGGCPKPVTLTRTESGQLTCVKPFGTKKPRRSEPIAIRSRSKRLPETDPLPTSSMLLQRNVACVLYFEARPLAPFRCGRSGWIRGQLLVEPGKAGAYRC
jgi:hypothetical protein